MRSVPFAPLDPALYREAVRRALAEDLGWGDVTTEATVEPCPARAWRDSRQERLRDRRDSTSPLRRSASSIPGSCSVKRCMMRNDARLATIVAEVSGSAAAMLTAERTALNFLQRLSGIATLTRRFVDAAGGSITILDTRKTTPTLRALEKYAVRAGGGTNHRAGLDDGILIKDNHIRLGGGVAEVGTKDEGGAPGDADRGRGAEPRAGGSRPSPLGPTSSSSTTCRSKRCGRRFGESPAGRRSSCRAGHARSHP